MTPIPQTSDVRFYGISGPPPSQTIASAPYRREPYVSVDLPGFGRFDGKATRWTPQAVLITGETAPGVRHSAWVPASWVRRISRDESLWRDPSDLLD